VFARVATFQGDPEKIDEVIALIQTRVESGEPPPGLEGARGMMMLVNRESGDRLGLTFFHSTDDMRRGDEALDAVNPGPTGRTGVKLYEIAIEMKR
jgi:hypothetical protein